tara:strand:- start:247 stop:1053 length:807 start_codon:yes stop_codon:yes gene_type:complete
MPEGPEVKRFGTDLARVVSGKTIKNIEVISGRYSKKPLPGLEEVKSQLPAKVIGVGVHGKFLYWIVDNGFFLHSSLGMTGHWGQKLRKHSRVEVTFHDDTKVYFTDQRNFGTLKFVYGKSALQKKIESLGPDMLAEDVSPFKFADRLRRKPKWPLSKVIMDQSVVAGVGNYVKAEALWRAHLSPHRTVESLTDIEMNTLNESIKDVLRESYSSGGATIRSYRTFDGSSGEYARRFAVYNQKEDPDGFEVIKEKTADGRTTHWVPQVQN